MELKNFKWDQDADGIVTLTWDVPGRTMNVLTSSAIAELAKVAETVAGDAAIKGLVITSGKANGFCAGAALLIFGACAIAIRDWRLAAAAGLASLLALSIGLWAMSGLATLGISQLLVFVQLFLIGATPLVAAAAGARGYLIAGDGMTVALARMLLRDAPAVILVNATSIVVWAGQTALDRRYGWVLAVAVAFALTALLVMPALAIAIETLFPRRATIQARYKVG